MGPERRGSDLLLLSGSLGGIYDLSKMLAELIYYLCIYCHSQNNASIVNSQLDAETRSGGQVTHPWYFTRQMCTTQPFTRRCMMYLDSISL